MGEKEGPSSVPNSTAPRAQGTVRSNLDPFGTTADNELWHALRLVHLRDAIAGGVGWGRFWGGLGAPNPGRG